MSERFPANASWEIKHVGGRGSVTAFIVSVRGRLKQYENSDE
jgi:hypothetical protein